MEPHSALEAIPRTSNGDQPRGLRRVVFDSLAKQAHVNIHRSAAPVKGPSPHAFEERLAAKSLSAMAREEEQKLVFFGTKGQDPSAALHLVSARVNRQNAKGHGCRGFRVRLGGGPLPFGHPRTPEHRTHACHELTHAEWL